jgi:hypothetical protein
MPRASTKTARKEGAARNPDAKAAEKASSGRRGRARSDGAGDDASSQTARADLSVFNRYLARATGTFKAPQVGRKPTRVRADVLKQKLDELDARKGNMTAAQYLRKRARILAGGRGGRKTRGDDLRARFLEALPRIMEREGWVAQDLQKLGVPYSDLVEIGVRKPRGPRARQPQGG